MPHSLAHWNYTSFSKNSAHIKFFLILITEIILSYKSHNFECLVVKSLLAKFVNFLPHFKFWNILSQVPILSMYEFANYLPKYFKLHVDELVKI